MENKNVPAVYIQVWMPVTLFRSTSLFTFPWASGLPDVCRKPTGSLIYRYFGLSVPSRTRMTTSTLRRDPVTVELQEAHKDRHRGSSVKRNPRPMQCLEFLGCLPQEPSRMNCRSFYEHDLVARPEERHRQQPLTRSQQAKEDPVACRLHAPTQNQGSGTCYPGEEPEGREEVAWGPSQT